MVAVSAVPVADAEETDHPSPCAIVSITDIPFFLGWTLTVWRSWDGQRVELRGARQVPILGNSWSITDYEAPIGAPVIYQVIVSAADGATMASVQSDPIRIELDLYGWVSDPFSPAVAARVIPGFATMLTKTYRRSGTLQEIQGSGLPVAVVGMRQQISNIDLAFICTDGVESLRVMSVLRHADPFVLRLPPRYEYPPLMYLTADEITQTATIENGRVANTVVACTATMVAAPRATVVVPTRTYGTVLAVASTYSDLWVSAPDYLSVLRGY